MGELDVRGHEADGPPDEHGVASCEEHRFNEAFEELLEFSEGAG